ncbi:telomere zinc finger-associated protein-like isoform X2 [Myxocyprinus asiaticus]|uniref:telomere zinc finger-associated protein-like isoform X2 n=1 Tax=Myxocyprinus asiaticus TaxID=70543 RepID=UPI00222340D3|nr:telomere zinc finger-associated protein-like isoform X2 [Myxocyprinus asiaticus]
MEIPAQEISHAQRVLFLLNQQRGLGQFCDAMLNTASGQVHLAHRNVLACFSQLFQDPSLDTPCVQITLPSECPDDGLELLLNLFYTGELHLDDSNLEKVQNAAIGLSVPDSLIPCQCLPSVEALQSPDLSGDSKDKPLFPLTPADSLPGQTMKGKTRSCLRTKYKSDACRSAVVVSASDDDHPASKSTTTTRSGRRVKGPSRLVGESPMSTLMRQGATRRKASSMEYKEEEIAATEEGDQLIHHDLSETEVDGSVLNQNDNDDQDDVDNDYDDDENDGGDCMDILIKGSDEEYVPHDSPCSTSKGPQGKCKQQGKNTNKENGEGTSKDTKKGSVQCPTCHKTFLSKYYLKVHNRRHTGEKPFECAKCGKCYYRRENLLEHEARNCLSRTEVVFSCSKCPMTFKKRHELRLHTVTHTGEMPNKCTSCPEQFMQKKDLRIHMIKVHGAPKPHACSLCPKCFLSRTELRLHEAAKHRGEKLFVCEECGHRASSRNGLQMHIKAIHRNERPFVCEFCNHAFTQKANLNMHLRTHTGEKPFQCHLCGKTFRTQEEREHTHLGWHEASLDKHHRTHTGERPYSCEFCEQRFTEKGPLLRHIASKHQEGRPHLCHICNKTFKAIEQLRVHVRRHKGMRKFECTDCGYKFTRQAHLRRHSQIHNRVQNYNPRQRRLRNLIVEDENAAASSSSSSQTEAQAGAQDIVAVVVEQVVSAPAGAAGGDQTTYSMMDGPVNGKQTGLDVKERTDGGVEQAGFTVADMMDQKLLYPIHQSSVVVELPSSGADEKI